MNSQRSIPGFKQFRMDGCLSYLVFDRETRDTLVVDPHLQMMEDYRSYIAENRLKPRVALDTHTHADHLSATHLFRDEYGSQIAMLEATRSQRVTRKLKHQDVLEIGKMKFQVLATPGHTPDSLCVYGSGMVFTGDTLLIGVSGRTDFAGADPAKQWEGLHQILEKLPAETLVFPGHDYSDLLFSILGVERKKNQHWLIPSLQEYVAAKSAERILTENEDVKKRLHFNIEQKPEAPQMEGPSGGTACGIQRNDVDRSASINVEKFHLKLKENAPGQLYWDVREQDEFDQGHAPGMQNIPLSEVGFYLSEVAQAKRIYVSCLSGRRSTMVTKTLSYLGIENPINVIGGYKAWVAAGLPIQR